MSLYVMFNFKILKKLKIEYFMEERVIDTWSS